MQTINKKLQKEQIETAIVRLNSIKSKVVNLRVNLEKIKVQTEIESRNICKKCKNLITKNEEVIFKDHSGKKIQHFHRKCFESLIASIS
jgi:hypothetical protein